ncbi:hypothetical protein WA026_002205 [Henosepilachna vigintioctopunctata]|uniref:Gustatory receptor n=1 Tax=Henosepilachna vigintioctopunctata TaxID=420089 RepID=A0AAW1TU89_9CUCU
MQVQYYSVISAYNGIEGIVLKFCQAMEIVIAFCKLTSNYMKSSICREILEDLAIWNTSFQKNYLKPEKKKQGYWFAAVLVFVFFEFLSLPSYKNVFWIFPVIKESVECEFIIFLLRNIQELFRVLNLQMSEYSTHLVDMQKFQNRNDSQYHPKNDGDYTARKIWLMKNLSLNHFKLVALSNNLNKYLSFNLLLTFMKLSVDFVHECHGLERFWIAVKDVNNLGWIYICWISYTFSHTSVLLYYWTSLEKEANRTVILLHDVCNTFESKNKLQQEEFKYVRLMSNRCLTAKLKFTLHGCFPLDWSVIRNMMYSTVTYLIILIQIKN